MIKSKTYGELKVTDAELKTAKALAYDDSTLLGENAYQLVRYCEGRMHRRGDAEQALAVIRATAA